jgi:hypothetical protein
MYEKITSTTLETLAGIALRYDLQKKNTPYIDGGMK